jgi:hypothetical protein
MSKLESQSAKATPMLASLAYLQTPSRIEGVGGGITTLNSGGVPGTVNCKALEITSNGLLVTGESDIVSLVPWANVKVARVK